MTNGAPMSGKVYIHNTVSVGMEGYHPISGGYFGAPRFTQALLESNSAGRAMWEQFLKASKCSTRLPAEPELPLPQLWTRLPESPGVSLQHYRAVFSSPTQIHMPRKSW